VIRKIKILYICKTELFGTLREQAEAEANNRYFAKKSLNELINGGTNGTQKSPWAWDSGLFVQGVKN